MSYGEWKALHYVPAAVVIPEEEEEEPEIVVEPSERVCLFCGNKINGGHALRKYCDDVCAYEGSKVRKRRYYKRKTERMIANGQV